MILKAKHNIVIYSFFKAYALWKIKRNFHAIQVIGKFKEKKLPVLLVSNHISWWDGFWAMYLNQKLLHRKFHFMMLEEQLLKYWFFNFTGGFSVNKKSKSIIETINYTSEILSNKNNMVLIFPQGEIQTIYKQTFIFEKGIEHIIQNTENRVQMLFLVCLVDYFSNPKPSIYLYIQEYTGSSLNSEVIQNQYNSFYKQCIDSQQQTII